MAPKRNEVAMILVENLSLMSLIELDIKERLGKSVNAQEIASFRKSLSEALIAANRDATCAYRPSSLAQVSRSTAKCRGGEISAHELSYMTLSSNAREDIFLFFETSS